MENGTVFADRFTVERLVSAGGMGYVYRALDGLTGLPVALKVVQRREATSTARFLREGKVLSELSHRRIVRYIAHGVSGSGDAYVAMEWLEGEDLGQRLRQRELSMGESVAVVIQACEGLALAHSKGLVHRDLKPSNLFLVGDDITDLKVIDFGVVHVDGDVTMMTQTGVLLGTPGYMAPEQVRGAKEIDARADVFALGCVLYRCLTGAAPFASQDRVAALTRVLFEEVRPLQEARPGIPVALDQLVARMLKKGVDERPKDAKVVLHALYALDLPHSRKVETPSRRGEALTQSEQRVTSLVLAAPIARDAVTLVAEESLARQRDLTEKVERMGARLERLPAGAFAAIAAPSAAPADQASQAARVALAIRDRIPDVLIAVATGLGDTSSGVPVGEVIERAAALLHRPPTQPSAADATLANEASPSADAEDGGLPSASPIYLDEVTAVLLRGRFEMDEDGGLRRLLGASATGEPVRTLLGKPTPCVGRERELSMLMSLYDECVSEPLSQAVVVTARPGVGKSRLRYEFQRSLEERDSVTVWMGRGDPMSAGAPYGMIAQVLRSTADLSDADPIEVRRHKLEARVLRYTPAEDAPRVIDFLGELAQVPFPDESNPQLRAARRDARLMVIQINHAWEDFLLAECRAHPLVLILEDLHWGDLPTVRLVDSALRALRDEPFLVVALARPELHELFPELWSERRVQPIPLSELTPKTTEKLARKVLGDGVDADVIKRIVDRAQGNAFYAEELIRAVAEGRGDSLPETVVAMTQTRLAGLEVDVRRAARAASVFGESFWVAGVAALVGGEAEAGPVDEWVDLLADREFVNRKKESRLPGQVELTFRHAFVRDAAYASLTPKDRALGHRLAGKWLERHGEVEPLVLAQHYELGDEKTKAVHFYTKAAEAALDGNDYAATCDRAARGLACGASNSAKGRLHALDAEALHWQGKPDLAAKAGDAALATLPEGSGDFLRVMGRLVETHGRRLLPGEMFADVERLVRAIEKGSAAPDVATIGAGALAETAAQLVYFSATEELERVCALAERAYGSSPDPAVRAWVFETRASRAMAKGDMGACLELMVEAAAGFHAAGDVRQACLELAHVVYGHLELGLYVECEATGLRAIADAERLGLSSIAAGARHNMGLAVALQGRLDEGEALERMALLGTREHGHKRLQTSCLIFLTLILRMKGDLSLAEATAREGLANTDPGLPMHAEALATLSSVLLAAGRTEEAYASGRAGYEASRASKELPDNLGRFVLLAYAEAAHRVGDLATAKRVIAHARARLTASAAQIRREDWRRSYLENIPENARTLALAEAWIARDV